MHVQEMIVFENVPYYRECEGNGCERNKQEDIRAILRLADNIHPIGILQVMHLLVISHHEAMELIKQLIKEGLLQWELEGSLFKISAKGRKGLEDP